MVCASSTCDFNLIGADPLNSIKSEKFATGGVIRAAITPDGK
jgi:hypothetical protein